MEHSNEQPWTSPILVTGGTGTLGRLVVKRLRDAGRDVRVLSRHLADVENGVDHVRGRPARHGPRHRRRGRRELGSSSTARAAPRATSTRRSNWCAARHRRVHCTLSTSRWSGRGRIPVEGRMDRAMFGYFASKFAAERIVADSGLPWTTLRATQFFDLTLKTCAADGQAAADPGSGRLPVSADRRRRGGGPTRGTRTRNAGWAGTGDRRAPRVRDGRPGARIPARGTRAPVDHPGSHARPGRGATVPARTWPLTGPSAAGPGRSS